MPPGFLRLTLLAVGGPKRFTWAHHEQESHLVHEKEDRKAKGRATQRPQEKDADKPAKSTSCWGAVDHRDGPLLYGVLAPWLPRLCAASETQ